MKKSFIFCYRDRETHLNITIPRIRELYPDCEIIVVEQNDNEKFRRANLFNIGAQKATGDLLIFHDIDYYPVDVLYYEGDTDVYLPVRRATFTYNDLTPKPLEEVPGGYRHFREAVDDDFFGAVEVFKRDAFFKINGFSTKFVGWGFEDADLRNRIAAHELSVQRGSGQFLALDHPDSGPSQDDQDFRSNIQLAYQFNPNYTDGVSTEEADIEEVITHHADVDHWYHVTNFNRPNYIMGSVF
jgi:hypothetical protein